MRVLSVTPYTANGELQSFDVVIADRQYVSLLATTGDTGVPFNYMSRWNNTDGSLKIHVDVPSTPIYGSLPVSVTFLSAQSGQPVCLSVVSFDVQGNATTPAPRPSYISGSSGPAPSTETSSTGGNATSGAATTTSASGTIPAASVTALTLGERLDRVCTGNGSLELWFLLITLYLAATAAVALTQPPLVNRSEYLPGVLIGVPFALLAAFWYLAPMCRGAGWVPLVLLLIAIAGVIVAFREPRTAAPMVQLPSPKPTPVASVKEKQAVPTKN